MNRNLDEMKAFLDNFKSMQDEILNWIQNKPRILVIMTFMQAMATDNALEIINNLNDLFPNDKVARYHTTNHWLKLYKNPSMAVNGAIDHVFKFLKGNKPLGQLIVTLLRITSDELKKKPDSYYLSTLTNDPTISAENALKIISF